MIQSDESYVKAFIDDLINEADSLIQAAINTSLIMNPKRREDRFGSWDVQVLMERRQSNAIEDHDNDVIYIGTVPSEVINLCTPTKKNQPRKRRGNPKEIQISAGVNCDGRQTISGSNRKKKNLDEENGSSSIAIVSPEKGECSVCLESALANNPTSTICGHVYCYGCIVASIRATEKCPLYFKRLSIENIHPIYL